MKTPHPTTRRLPAFLLTLATLAGGLVATVALTTAAAPPAAAVTGSQFNPGMIITDGVFYNSGSMNAGQIQNFLAAQYQGCASGYTCIRDLHVDTFTRPADAMCAQYTGAPGEAASLIIWKVSQACGVNPQSMIVLLQKESSVITSTTPNYRSATGYGCPDTAACDSRYYGFYNQVYMAAWQFRRYRAYPNDYGYVAGRSNYILYNPNRACGGSNVYISNQATAGLYIYTPYQPNQAALNNLYGTGDSCSAYGNRNFWRMFNDWFGSTSATGTVNPLQKSATDPTVYLVSGTNKYAVADWDTLMALPASWRGIATVPQSTLDGFKTGTTLHRLVQGGDGGVWFFDAGIKLHVPSCDMVADYGYSCTKPIPALLDNDLAAFATGPTMTSLYTTTTGRRYEITAGTRREVLDDTALQQAGLSTATVVLTPSAIAALPLGAPLVHDGAMIVNRDDNSAVLLRGSVTYRFSASTYQQTTLAKTLPAAGALDGASVAQLANQVELTGFARDATTKATFVLTTLGRSAITTTDWGVTPTTWPSDLLGAVQVAPPLSAPMYVKGTTLYDVAMLGGGVTRKVPDWGTLVALAGDPSPYIATLTDAEYQAVPVGPALLPPGTLAKGNDPAIWYIDGQSRKIHLSSMTIAAQLGLGSWTTDNSAVGDYSAVTGDLTPALACGSQRYLGADGSLRTVSADQATAWGLTFAPLTAATCRAVKAGAALTGPVFVRTVSNGTVYQLGDGTKHPVTSYPAYTRVSSSSSVGIQYLPDGALDAIPTGSPIS